MVVMSIGQTVIQRYTAFHQSQHGLLRLKHFQGLKLYISILKFELVTP